MPDRRWCWPDAHGYTDATVSLWDTVGGERARLQSGNHPISSAVFFPDGAPLASGCDRDVRLWALGGGALAVLRGHLPPVRSSAFSPDGAVLASESDDGDIRLWDMDAARGQFAPSAARGGDAARRPKSALPEGRDGPD